MPLTPKVSVIVCTYNQEATIGRALDSILSQRVDFPYEIILADDCSADSTPEICRRYASLHPDVIRLFINPHNKGVVDNYFDCVEASRGTYISDLAGDDEWIDPDKLAKQARILDSDKEISLCHAAWRPVYPDGTIGSTDSWCIPDKAYISRQGELTLSLLRHEKRKAFIHLCTAMYRRDLVIGLMARYPTLFRDKLLTCEDLQINVMLSHAGMIAYIPDIVLHYSVGNPSVSSDEDPLKVIRFYSGIVRLTARIAVVLGINSDTLSGYYHEVMQYIIMQYFVNHLTDGRKLIIELIKDTGIPLSLKNRITILLSSGTTLWQITTKIREILLNLHHSFLHHS